MIDYAILDHLSTKRMQLVSILPAKVVYDIYHGQQVYAKILSKTGVRPKTYVNLVYAKRAIVAAWDLQIMNRVMAEIYLLVDEPEELKKLKAQKELAK